MNRNCNLNNHSNFVPFITRIRFIYWVYCCINLLTVQMRYYYETTTTTRSAKKRETSIYNSWLIWWIYQWFIKIEMEKYQNLWYKISNWFTNRFVKVFFLLCYVCWMRFKKKGWRFIKLVLVRAFCGQFNYNWHLFIHFTVRM